MTRRLKVRPMCPYCDELATALQANDRTTYYECGHCKRIANTPPQGEPFVFVRRDLWKLRNDVHGVMAVLYAARMKAHHEDRSTARITINAWLSTWLGREAIGSVDHFTYADCRNVLVSAGPIMEHYGKALIENAEDRVTLYVAAAKQRRFPKLWLWWEAWRVTLRSWVLAFVMKLRVRP